MTRRLEFATTEAVELARRRDRFIPCPACGSSQQRYLFHRTGARFVRCRACDLVYADPVDISARGYFDIAALGTHADTIDHDHLVADFTSLLGDLADSYETRTGRRPRPSWSSAGGITTSFPRPTTCASSSRPRSSTTNRRCSRSRSRRRSVPISGASTSCC